MFNNAKKFADKINNHNFLYLLKEQVFKIIE